MEESEEKEESVGEYEDDRDSGRDEFRDDGEEEDGELEVDDWATADVVDAAADSV